MRVQQFELPLLSAVCLAALVACGGDDGGVGTPTAIPFTVGKANCGDGDRPEAGLQGQVPVAERAAGFKGYNCNLQLIGQVEGDGASYMYASATDKSGRDCGYHDTSSNTVGRTHQGVVVLDLANKGHPVAAQWLTSPAMLDPWESLKTNARRGLLAATNGLNGPGMDGMDVYDVSIDCRSPQLLSSTSALSDTAADIRVNGHEGAWAPDGLTYYIGDFTNHTYHAIDMSDPTHPQMISTFAMPFFQTTPGAYYDINGTAHGLSISDDGNRAYFTSLGFDSTGPNGAESQTATPRNGLLVVDVSDVQARKSGAQMKALGNVLWTDGQSAQMTIPIKIGGKPFVVFTDEVGAGGMTPASIQSTCDANVIPFGVARLIDVSDETKPNIAARLILESNDPKNCAQVTPEYAGEGISLPYTTHYCSVDNRENATTLACSNFTSGIRVYDVRNPRQVKEIAYFNPPATSVPSPGSNNPSAAKFGGPRPDVCAAQIHLDASTGTLQTTCMDNGFLSLKFTHGVWPFPQTTTVNTSQN